MTEERKPAKRTNLARLTAVLSGFDMRNAPRRTSDIIVELGLSRTTGFALLRAMVKAELLERTDHGLLRLGPAARRLIFAPIDGHHAQPISGRVSAAPSSSEMSVFQRSEGVWNAAVTDVSDTSRYRRSGRVKIGFANASLSNPWRRALLDSMHYAVRLHRDRISGFMTSDADDDVGLQCDQIDEMVRDGVDLLIVSATQDQFGRIAECIDRHGRKGLPVVAVDRRPSDLASIVSFVTASDATVGGEAALWLAERLKGTGRIWMLSGVEGASPAIRRRQSALEVFEGWGAIDVEAIRDTGWTESGGRAAVLELLDEHGHPPDGIWCDSGLQGVGSIQAFLDLGLPVPAHTGGDLNKMYKLAIRHSVPFVAVDYSAAMGARSIETALAVLDGIPVARRIETPLTTVMPRGCETRSVKADEWAELHVRWDLPDDAVLSQGPSLPMPGRDVSMGAASGL